MALVACSMCVRGASPPGHEYIPSLAQQRSCKLNAHRAGGALFDLSPLKALSTDHKGMLIVRGATGGAFDHSHMRYEYHFTLCGDVGPPIPFDCMGNKDITRSPVYQIVAPQAPDKSAGALDEWDEEERLNHNCYALGSQIDWTYSLIDDSRPGKGLAIHYKGGQECYKRVVEKTKTEGGRQKREVKWVPTPRSTTLLLRCSTTSRTGREAFERTMGKGARASEDDMCHYTIEWDTPAACPSNLPSFPVEGEDDGEEVIYEDASGPHRTTRGAVKRTQVYGKVVAALVMLGVMAAVVLAVQIYRFRTWMRVIIPQMSDSNPVQKRIARKKFVKLIFSVDGPRKVRHNTGRLV